MRAYVRGRAFRRGNQEWRRHTRRAVKGRPIAIGKRCSFASHPPCEIRPQSSTEWMGKRLASSLQVHAPVPSPTPCCPPIPPAPGALSANRWGARLGTPAFHCIGCEKASLAVATGQQGVPACDGRASAHGKRLLEGPQGPIESGWVGTEQLRSCRLEGDKLVIESPPAAQAGRSMRGILEWEREQ